LDHKIFDYSMDQSVGVPIGISFTQFEEVRTSFWSLVGVQFEDDSTDEVLVN